MISEILVKAMFVTHFGPLKGIVSILKKNKMFRND